MRITISACSGNSQFAEILVDHVRVQTSRRCAIAARDGYPSWGGWRAPSGWVVELASLEGERKMIQDLASYGYCEGERRIIQALAKYGY